MLASLWRMATRMPARFGATYSSLPASGVVSDCTGTARRSSYLVLAGRTEGNIGRLTKR